jgi:hypothetical protein
MLLLATVRGLPHFAQDDLACSIPSQGSGPHDESRHGLNAAVDAAERDHCALCHWSRSLRSPLTALAISVASVVPASVEYGAVEAVPVAPVLDHLPARAPPATLL